MVPYSFVDIRNSFVAEVALGTVKVKEYTSHALCRVELQYIVSTQLWLP
jgi:hypothetical protein